MENKFFEKSQNKKEDVSLLEVEKSANFEGNETILFLERLQNPTIRTRLVNDLYEHLSSYKYRNMDEDDARREIEADLDNKIENIATLTNIKNSEESDEILGKAGDGFGLIYLHSINPDTGKEFSSKSLSIIEAHEKGHELRDFRAPTKFSDRIREVFDFDNAEVPQTYIESYKKMRPESTDEDAEFIIRHYHSELNEIYERMAQLKNYYGMKGDEVFTKEHLKYARENYGNDTGLLSQMQVFFNAITPEKEEKFIELMNSLGV